MATTSKKATPAEVKETTFKASEAVATKVNTEAVQEAPKKEAAPKTEKKSAAKNSTAPKSEKKPTAKKTTKKKDASYEDAVSAAKKKMASANISRLKYPVALNVELNGTADGIFYIYVVNGSFSVEPYKYDDYDVYMRADAETFLEVMNGQKNIYDALADGSIKIDGNTKKAILIVNAAF